MALALGLAHLLHDHLLGVLRRHAAEIEGRQGLGDQVADLGFGTAPLGVAERHLRRVVLHLLDDLQDTSELGLARLRVDFAANVVLGAVARFRCLLDRVFHRLDDDLAIDRLLTRYRIGNLQQLEPISTYACLCHAYGTLHVHTSQQHSGGCWICTCLLRTPKRLAN